MDEVSVPTIIRESEVATREKQTHKTTIGLASSEKKKKLQQARQKGVDSNRKINNICKHNLSLSPCPNCWDETEYFSLSYPIFKQLHCLIPGPFSWTFGLGYQQLARNVASFIIGRIRRHVQWCMTLLLYIIGPHIHWDQKATLITRAS